MVVVSPTVAGWALATRIRNRRQALGLEPRSIVERLGISRAYWSRVEKHRALLSENMFRQVLDLLRLEEAGRDELTGLWRRAREREWFADYGALVGDTVRRFYGLEQGASHIRDFNGSMITGLLQTDEYARVVIESFATNRRTDHARLRDLRSRRQELILHSADPPEITVLMSETNLWQQIGDKHILREQLRHLLTLIEQHADHLRVRVLPFDQPSVGALASAASVVFMDFEEAVLPTVAFIEAVIALVIVDDAVDVDTLAVLFGQDMASSLDERGTEELIRRRLDDL